MQLRVVACVPVPKAMPGSMVITWRRRNFGGVNHGGVTQKLLPTRRGLMNRFQEFCQFSGRDLPVTDAACRRGRKPGDRADKTVDIARLSAAVIRERAK